MKGGDSPLIGYPKEGLSAKFYAACEAQERPVVLCSPKASDHRVAALTPPKIPGDARELIADAAATVPGSRTT